MFPGWHNNSDASEPLQVIPFSKIGPDPCPKLFIDAEPEM